MERPIVAVEDKLQRLRQILEEEGVSVVGLEDGLDEADVVLVSGMDDNVTGAQDRLTEASVINVEGMAPHEVLDEVRRAGGLRLG